MNRNRYYLIVLFVCIILLPASSFGEEKEKPKSEYEIPSHVLNISKENTFPNSTEDQEIVEPSELTKELINDLEVPVENPDLIKMLNETTLKPSPLAIGYRGMVYVGRWALNYSSLDTTINWEFQPINMNELNNQGGDNSQKMNYVQQEEKEVKGALTNKITNPADIKKMMLLKSKEKTKLPLSYQTVIGHNTKKDNSYNVPVQKYATLQAYAPAVNEKGQVTFGEVYIELRGSKKSIVLKNVTKQGIGAWIPIQDHISFSFQLK
ncbi:YfkD family protein [Virgibacillus sp. C22-A2]|uniref:YfkD family protein n=1 Tax=Virgibacillus tibetensis TaxID=3042313 RepID=A0ABU6KG52_9BACI|nr:YfkD family protein [Virgibacillus sp. C22-A2]